MPKRKKKARNKKKSPQWCVECSKIIRPTREDAVQTVAAMKLWPDVRRSDLLDAYRCPQGNGWHVGHNYKRR